MIENIIVDTHKENIEAVGALLENVFGESIEDNELKWLLENPDLTGEFNSKHVISNGEITGHVGFVNSTYLIYNKEVTGVHATNLCVIKGCPKGMGKKMFEIVSYEPDISIIYEGTPSAIRLYPKSGFKKVGISELFSTVILFPTFSELIQSTSLKSFAKKVLLPLKDKWSRLGTSLKTDRDITFETLKETDLVHHVPLDNALTNAPNRNKINWFTRCSQLKSLVFTVMVKNAPVGILYIYINEKGDHKTGRIAYMPNMGENENYWQAVLAFAEQTLKLAQVRSYTIYASHPKLRKLLTSNGFTKERDRVIWVYDEQNITDNVDMHLMHFEGDHAFRGV
jgi:hypothetical protein